VLATSRAPLHIAAEREFPLAPLALPNLRQRYDLPDLAAVAAIALFLQRAQTVRPDFTMTAENATAVTEICVRLDGLPLAIELAAARMRLLAPRELLTRLSSRLRLLTRGFDGMPARHQTMRGAIAWSHELLSADERRLFRRLAVFAGGWTMEAAEAICAAADLPADAILDLTEALLDQSLIRGGAVAPDAARLTMYETIRAYAGEELAAGGEREATERRHAACFLALAERAEPLLRGKEQAQWLARLDADHDNLRAALAWARDAGEAEIGLRLAGALWWYWNLRAMFTEGALWLTTMLALPAAHVPPAIRAKALNGAGVMAYRRSDLDAAEARHTEALTLLRHANAERSIAETLNHLGNVAYFRGAYDRAAAWYTESATIRRRLGDPAGIATALHNLGMIARYQGDEKRAATLLEESAAIKRETGNLRALAQSLEILADIALHAHQHDRAAALFEEMYDLFVRLNDPPGIAEGTNDLGRVAAAQSQYARAAALHERALALNREINHGRGIADALRAMGDLARHQHEDASAWACYWESLDVGRSVQYRQGAIDCLLGIAALLAGGDAERAAALLGAITSHAREMGHALLPLHRETYMATEVAARAALGAARYTAAWTEGAARALNEAIALARAGMPGGPPHAPRY
jgi:predicted ATPase